VGIGSEGLFGFDRPLELEFLLPLWLQLSCRSEIQGPNREPLTWGEKSSEPPGTEKHSISVTATFTAAKHCIQLVLLLQHTAACEQYEDV